ncbi:hypothetical protein C8Q77DRAFT_47869 [Trametes polyzona]|nr:hypothetical protein C8Q77DRAFT_47869 [Trametes polyzona]
MLSFAANVNVLLLILSIVALHAPRRVAGAPTNTTLRLNSTLVSFTTGWRVATFAEDGSQFAFANGFNERVKITLPHQTTDVFYQGYKAAGGALFFACVDCVADIVDLVGGGIVATGAVVVDAHDARENGTQPPDTLFSFTGLDPTVDHVLTVVNLEDPRFNNTSQITFDSVNVTLDSESGSNATSTVSNGATLIPNLPTVTVTADQTSTDTSPTTSSAEPVGHGPIFTSGDTTVAASTTSDTSAPSTTDIVGSTKTTLGTSTSDTTTSTPPPGGDRSTTITVGVSSPSGKTTASALPPARISVSGSRPAPTVTSSTASQVGTSGVGASSISTPTGGGTGASSAGSSPPGGTAQPSDAGPPGRTSPSTGGTSTSPGDGGSVPQPSVSPIFTLPPQGSGMSSASTSGQPTTTGVSQPVIIAIAVVASLFVLALLGAVLVVLVRNRNARRPADPEGNAGLMTEAAPYAVAAPVSAPMGLAPMRPVNPFADTVAADIPLDAPPGGAAAQSDTRFFEDVFVEPLAPPPPIPVKSPLRGSFKTSPWLNRVPRNSSPNPLP